jgi:Na+/melibiose symporter-like transporter
MYVSALPLAVTFYLLFIPPEGLGQVELFGWLTVFAILVRGSMTLYHVPHLALGAELSSDYHERTGIVGYRTVFGIGGAFTVTVLGFFYFFRPTAEYAQGQLNPAAYPLFAGFFALAMLATIWYSALGTHARIPTLTAAPDQPEPFSARRVMGEVVEVLRNRSFRNLFIGIVIFFVMRGVQFTLGLHLNTYFWGLETYLIGVVGVVIVSGILIGVPVWARISRTIDKKPTFLSGMVIFTVFAVLPPVLKIVGIWPAHENTGAYLAAIAGMGFVAAFGGAAALVAAGSMMADLTDEHELATGRRQEGIFFSVLSFAGKSSSGLGHQIAGIGIDLIGFPIGAAPGTIAQPIVDNLGILYGPGLLPLAALSMIFLVRYNLSRERLTEIQSELAQRRATVPVPNPTTSP